MFRVMLTYELFGSGMERLKRETDLFVSNSGEIAPYVERLRWADAFITRSVHPDSATLETCTRLKVIGIPGVGYQSYDIDLLNRMGIALVYCPGMNLRSVAEHAVALCYALTKRIVEDDREVHRDNYGVRNSFNHLELLGCHAGVAGFGTIGRETARLFRANGMEVYVHTSRGADSTRAAHAIYDRLLPASGLRGRGVKSKDLAVLRETAMPAVLVELGFISSDNDRAKLVSDEWQERAAEAIASGIMEAVGKP